MVPEAGLDGTRLRAGTPLRAADFEKIVPTLVYKYQLVKHKKDTLRKLILELR